jgi:predicted Zn-dependent protease with MMP-like domain
LQKATVLGEYLLHAKYRFISIVNKEDSVYQSLMVLADEVVKTTCAKLPAEVRVKAKDLIILLEPWPSEELVEDGIEPDLLGLFSGDAYPDGQSDAPLPPQVHLFLENLWDYCQGDETRYREEIRVTYLHELGHYLGLDEDELFQRDLA